MEKSKKLDVGKLVDILLDHQNEDDEKIIHLIEDAISEHIGFNHAADEIGTACKIDMEKNKHVSIQANFNKISEEVEALEKVFTKREITYIAVMGKQKLEKTKKILELITTLKKKLDE